MIQRGYKDLKDDRVFSLDWPHGYVTRDGHKARILCTDLRDRRTIGGGEYPIVAVFDRGDGTESLCTFTMNGRQFSGELSEKDLCNAPAPKQKYELWIGMRRNPESNRIEYDSSCTREGIHHWMRARGCKPIGAKLIVIEEGESL